MSSFKIVDIFVTSFFMLVNLSQLIIVPAEETVRGTRIISAFFRGVLIIKQYQVDGVFIFVSHA